MIVLLVFVLKELRKLSTSVVCCVLDRMSLSLLAAINGTWDDILDIDDCFEKASFVVLDQNKKQISRILE